MGCGVSTDGHQTGTPGAKDASKDGSRALGKTQSSMRRANGKEGSVKEGPSLLQMGSKKVRNSFTVNKQRSTIRRESEAGSSLSPNAADGASPAKGDASGDASSAGQTFAKLKANMSRRIASALPDEAVAFPVEGTGTRVRRNSFVLPMDVTLDDAVLVQPRAMRRNKGLQVDSTPSGQEASAEELPIKPDEFATHASALSTGEGRAVADSVAYFRKLTMGKGVDNIRKLRTDGIVPGLVRQLQNGSLSVQVEAAWALTNMCSGGPEEVTNAIDCGVLDAFVKLLENPNECLIEQVLWGLGNVAAEQGVPTPQLARPGVISSVIKAASTPATSGGHVVRNASWLFANLARSNSFDTDIQNQLLPFCRQVALGAADEEAKAHAAWAIAYVMADADHGSAARFAITQMRDLVRALVAWVSGSTGPTPAPAVRLLHHLAGGGEAEAAAVLEADGIPALLQCARQSSFHQAIRCEAVTTLTRLALRGSTEVQALLQAGAFEVFIGLLRIPAAPPEFHRRCVLAISAPWMPMVSLNDEPAHALLELGVIHILCTRWTLEESVGTLVASMEGINNALRKGQRLMMARGHSIIGASTAGTSEAAPRMCNPVAEVVSEEEHIKALQSLIRHSDPSVSSKAQSLLNMLQFMA